MALLGMPYPLQSTPKGYMPTVGTVDTITADLLILLLTNPGERVMLPTFGTPLKTLLFEQNDTVLAANARQMIINAIQTWEPRIVMNNITVTSNASVVNNNNENNNLSIYLEFTIPPNITDVQYLILEVPLSS